MLAFMWQDDLIGVAKYVIACVQKMSQWKGRIKGWVKYLISLVSL